jgi:hypothetical protein
MLFGFCKRGHPRTKETTFERRVVSRNKATGWERTYLARECRICHSLRNVERERKPWSVKNSTSKWKRFLEDAQ